MIYLIAAIVKPTSTSSNESKNNSDEERWEENIFNYEEILSRLLSYIESLQHPQIRMISFPAEVKKKLEYIVFSSYSIDANYRLFSGNLTRSWMSMMSSL